MYAGSPCISSIRDAKATLLQHRYTHSSTRSAGAPQSHARTRTRLRQGAGDETRSTVVIDRRRMANDDSDSDVSLDGL